MITYGYPQLLVITRHSRPLMITCNYSWLLATTHDYSWLLTITHDYSRILMSTQEHSWVLTITHDYPRFLTHKHEYSRLLPITREHSRRLLMITHEDDSPLLNTSEPTGKRGQSYDTRRMIKSVTFWGETPSIGVVVVSEYSNIR